MVEHVLLVEACNCPNGFTGAVCDEDVDDCVDNMVKMVLHVVTLGSALTPSLVPMAAL